MQRKKMNMKLCIYALVFVGCALSPYCLAEDKKPDKAATPLIQTTLHGYCPVSYFTDGQAIKGDAKFQSRYLGEDYFFANAKAKKSFDAEPDRYLPQFGGWCTLSLGGPYGKRNPGDPEVFAIEDGKLYLFWSQRALNAYEPRVNSILRKAPRMFAKPQLFGYSPVAYQKQKKAVKGKPEFRAVFRRQMFHFANESDRQLFIKSPEQYTPLYAGYCAMSLAKGSRYYADPNFFAVVDKRTYLFLNQEMKDSFMLNPAKAIAGADILWIGIQGDGTR